MDRILVIDDFEAARTQIRLRLQTAGFFVVEQQSAIGATRTILENRIRAAVVDVSMPGLSGDKLVGILRKNPRLRDLVIVIVSGKCEEELRRIRRASGANAVLSKSQLDELVPILKGHLEQTAADGSRDRAAGPAFTRRA